MLCLEEIPPPQSGPIVGKEGGWCDHNKTCLINLRKEPQSQETLLQPAILGKLPTNSNLGKPSLNQQNRETFIQLSISRSLPTTSQIFCKMDDDTLDRIYTGHLGNLPRLSTKVILVPTIHFVSSHLSAFGFIHQTRFSNIQ